MIFKIILLLLANINVHSFAEEYIYSNFTLNIPDVKWYSDLDNEYFAANYSKGKNILDGSQIKNLSSCIYINYCSRKHS